MKHVLVLAILFSTSAFANISNLVCTSNNDGWTATVSGEYTTAAETPCKFETSLQLFESRSVHCTTATTSKTILMGFTEEQGPAYVVQILQKGEKEEPNNPIASLKCPGLGKLVRYVDQTDINDKSDE